MGIWKKPSETWNSRLRYPTAVKVRTAPNDSSLAAQPIYHGHEIVLRLRPLQRVVRQNSVAWNGLLIRVVIFASLPEAACTGRPSGCRDRTSTRLNSRHGSIS